MSTSARSKPRRRKQESETVHIPPVLGGIITGIGAVVLVRSTPQPNASASTRIITGIGAVVLVRGLRRNR